MHIPLQLHALPERITSHLAWDVKSCLYLLALYFGDPFTSLYKHSLHVLTAAGTGAGQGGKRTPLPLHSFCRSFMLRQHTIAPAGSRLRAVSPGALAALADAGGLLPARAFLQQPAWSEGRCSAWQPCCCGYRDA